MDPYIIVLGTLTCYKELIRWEANQMKEMAEDVTRQFNEVRKIIQKLLSLVSEGKRLETLMIMSKLLEQMALLPHYNDFLTHFYSTLPTIESWLDDVFIRDVFFPRPAGLQDAELISASLLPRQWKLRTDADADGFLRTGNARFHTSITERRQLQDHLDATGFSLSYPPGRPGLQAIGECLSNETILFPASQLHLFSGLRTFAEYAYEEYRIENAMIRCLLDRETARRTRNSEWERKLSDQYIVLQDRIRSMWRRSGFHNEDPTYNQYPPMGIDIIFLKYTWPTNPLLLFPAYVDARRHADDYLERESQISDLHPCVFSAAKRENPELQSQMLKNSHFLNVFVVKFPFLCAQAAHALKGVKPGYNWDSHPIEIVILARYIQIESLHEYAKKIVEARISHLTASLEEELSSETSEMEMSELLDDLNTRMSAIGDMLRHNWANSKDKLLEKVVVKEKAPSTKLLQGCLGNNTPNAFLTLKLNEIITSLMQKESFLKMGHNLKALNKFIEWLIDQLSSASAGRSNGNPHNEEAKECRQRLLDLSLGNEAESR